MYHCTCDVSRLACKAVGVVVTGNHVDDVLRNVNILSHAGEHGPLILIHANPAQPSGERRIDHVSELIVAETEVRVEKPRRLQLIEKVHHRLACTPFALRDPNRVAEVTKGHRIIGTSAVALGPLCRTREINH